MSRANTLLSAVICATLIPVCSLFSPPAFAESPNPAVEEAARLLDQAIVGRRDELREDKVALYALIDEILLPRFDQRYAAQLVIDEILLPRFDQRYAAQLVLARHWRTASEEQRDRFINAFYKNMMRLYAEAILEFNLARLEVLPFRGDASKKRTTVKTIMRLDDGTKVPVNYGMVSRESGWKMFDVTIEGISYVRNYKAELNAEIQVEGLDGVIARLQAKNNESAAE